MTRDDVIRMAREVGFNESNAVCAVVVRHSNESWVGIEERLAMFAKLVAQHEREECAHMAAAIGGIWGQQANGKMIADAIRARGEQ